MQLENVPIETALRRMRIYTAGQVSVAEYRDTAKALLSGHEVTYTAYDTFGQPIGQTRITPQDFPVTLVTETNT